MLEVRKKTDRRHLALDHGCASICDRWSTCFFAAVPRDATDLAALHMFRIRGKELRYAMEVLAGAFSDEFRTRLYPIVESIQERLGEVNDLVTAKAKIESENQPSCQIKKKTMADFIVRQASRIGKRGSTLLALVHTANAL